MDVSLLKWSPSPKPTDCVRKCCRFSGWWSCPVSSDQSVEWTGGCWCRTSCSSTCIRTVTRTDPPQIPDCGRCWTLWSLVPSNASLPDSSSGCAVHVQFTPRRSGHWFVIEQAHHWQVIAHSRYGHVQLIPGRVSIFRNKTFHQKFKWKQVRCYLNRMFSIVLLAHLWVFMKAIFCTGLQLLTDQRDSFLNFKKWSYWRLNLRRLLTA